MYSRLACASSLIALTLSVSAAAQNAADRVDPARVEERSKEPEAPSGGSGALQTEVQAAGTHAPSVGVTVGAIDIVGLRQMSRTRFADIVQGYVGQTLTQSQLSELIDRLAARARREYPLASATIEPQSIRAGVLRVRIDEGIIDEVRVDGPANPAVLAALKPLAAGKPVSGSELEKRLLIAGDIQGVTLSRSRVVQEGGRNILVVKIAYREFRAQVTLDNDSTKPVGPLEVLGSLRFNGVVAPDDSLSVAVLNAVPRVSELSYLRARYSKRLSPAGTELTVTGSYSQSAPGSYLKHLDIESASWLASVGVEHPLWRSRRSSLWIEGSASHRQLHRDRADVLTRRDKLTVLKAGLYGFTKLAGGRLSANASLARGLDLLDATRRSDPLASRGDADGTFTTLVVSADWSRRIIGGLSTKVAVRWQEASQPLLLSEEIGLGGATFGRGYDYNERSGDEGIMGYGELRYKWDKTVGPLNGLELYAFADAGRVTNLASGFGGGSLYSSGGGLRADVDKRTDATLEVAMPLSGPRYDDDSKGPRVRFSITRYF